MSAAWMAEWIGHSTLERRVVGSKPPSDQACRGVEYQETEEDWQQLEEEEQQLETEEEKLYSKYRSK